MIKPHIYIYIYTAHSSAHIKKNGPGIAYIYIYTAHISAHISFAGYIFRYFQEIHGKSNPWTTSSGSCRRIAGAYSGNAPAGPGQLARNSPGSGKAPNIRKQNSFAPKRSWPWKGFKSAQNGAALSTNGLGPKEDQKCVKADQFCWGNGAKICKSQ